MGRSLICYTNVTQTVAANGSFLGAAAGAGSSNQVVTEDARKVVSGVSGALIGPLTVRADGVGTGRSVTTRINSVSGSLSVTPTDFAAGVYQDTLGQDRISSAGIPIDFITATTSNSPIFTFATCAFQGSTCHAALYSAVTGSSSPTVAANTSNFYSISGGPGIGSSLETQYQFKIRQPGTALYAYVVIPTNTGSSSTMTFRKNGVAGNNTVAFNGVTGTFIDTTHTDTLVSGDLINFVMNSTAGSLVAVSNIGVTIVSTPDGTNTNDVIFSCALVSLNGLSTTGTQFFPIGGEAGLGSSIGTGFSATEQRAQIRHGFEVIASNMRVNVASNLTTAGSTMRSRKNSANGNMVITIGSGLTGYFEDTTNSDTLAEIDDYCFSFAAGSTNGIKICVGGITEREITFVQQNSFEPIAGDPVVKVIGY